jgi:hypothetical protein
MRVNIEHLKKSGKITLYIPQSEIPFVESLINKHPEISFSELVLRSLKQKYQERRPLQSLAGSLKGYATAEAEDMEHIRREVARNAAEEGDNR